MKRILITGSNGFIGHHVLDYFKKKGDYEILAHTRSMFDLKDSEYPELPKFDYIIHIAANTWVDGSLQNCLPYVQDNVVATATLLEYIKNHQKQAKVCIFSSDEVLGPADIGEYFDEECLLKPSNPYSATKAAQESLAYSFAHSFGLDIFIVRCMNVFGSGESKKKFIGKTIDAIKNGKKIILHGKNKEDVASRHWVHAQDVASAVDLLLDKAKTKEKYHISGEEMDVYTMASILFKEIKGREISDEDVEFLDYHSARPGHDKRYSLSSKKLRALGWSPKLTLKDGLKNLKEVQQ